MSIFQESIECEKRKHLGKRTVKWSHDKKAQPSTYAVELQPASPSSVVSCRILTEIDEVVPPVWHYMYAF